MNYDSETCAPRSSASAAITASTSCLIRWRPLQRAGGALARLARTASRGRLCAGEIPKLPLNLVLLKGCHSRRVLGSWVRRDKDEYKAAIDQLAHWCAEASCRATFRRFIRSPRRRRAKALADRKVMGKLVVRV